MMEENEYIKRVLITLGLLSLFLLLAIILQSAVEVLLLIFTGILFAIFVRALSTFLFIRLLSLPENTAIVLTLLLLASVFAAFIIFLAPQLSEQAEKLLKRLPEALKNINSKIGYLDWFKNLVQSNKSSPLGAAGNMTSRFLGIFATTFGIVSSVFIVMFVALYMCFTPRYYMEGALRLLPPNQRERGRQIFIALNRILGRWIIGRIVGMLVVSLVTFLGLFILDVPLPLGLAIMAGLLTFIPYLGPIIAAVPAFLLSFMQSSTTGLYVILLYLFVQTIESYVITPLIQQKEISLPPVLTLASQAVLGNIFGFLGVMVASPLTASSLVLVKMLYIRNVFHEDTDTDDS